ncbi:MAG: putative signal transduction protein with EAL and GGDEF domain [Oleiphilaceae bacterium]|jgi:predicted signal transduction protein with EAL and GGDEF domain
MILFFNRIVFGVFILTIGFQAHSFEVSATNERISLDPHLSYYQDSEGTLSFGDIVALTSKGKLTKNTGGVLNFGFTDSVLWVHANISFSESVYEHKSWMISLDYAPLKNIDFYVRAGGKIRHITSGTSLPFQSRPIQYRNFVYPLTNNEDTQHDIWLRVQSDTSLQVPMSLWANQKFFENETLKSYGWGIFFGILIALGLYNLFLFVSVRDMAYLYYVLYLVGLSGFVLFLNGQGFQFIWSNTESWNHYALLFSSCFAGFWALQFSRSFLETKKYLPGFDRFIILVMAFSVLCTLIGAYGVDVSLPKLSGWIAVLFVITVVATAIKSYLIGHPIAPYFGIAWSFFLTGILVYVASVFGLAPTNYWTDNAVQFGSATEAILLSLGLAQRIKLERKQRYQALQSEHKSILKWQQAEKKLIERASYDSLTMLPNSTLLYKCIEDFKAASTSQDKRFGLILIRFKRFHEVSKTLGNNQANRLFIRAADRLSNEAGRLVNLLPICRSIDYFHFLSVIDSTTFAVLVEMTDHSQASQEVAESLLNVMKKPIEHEGILIDINAIAGIVTFPDHGDNLDTLTQHASIALDNSNSSSQSISTYSQDQNYYSTRRLSLMGDLLKAIDSDELTLFLQPQVNLTTGQVIGAEALIRWKHDTYGFVPPDEFIPLSEQSGIIRPLTSWVFDKALQFDKNLQSLGHDIRLSINISVKNIAEASFVKNKLDKLEQNGVKPERFVFEMTESIMMDDIDMSLPVLKELNELGIKLSIDDFGTGHSSLSYLTQLPVHELKIDRSFVSDMLEQPHKQKIVEMTINLAHSLGLSVVAEGIEDEATLSHLKSLNCDVAQGYYIGRPMPYDSFVDWLEDNKKADFTENNISSNC